MALTALSVGGLLTNFGALGVAVGGLMMIVGAGAEVAGRWVVGAVVRAVLPGVARLANVGVLLADVIAVVVIAGPDCLSLDAAGVGFAGFGVVLGVGVAALARLASKKFNSNNATKTRLNWAILT